MQTLTVSIVNFNSGNYIINCLDSLEKIKDEVDLEIYVADNASTDDSLKKIKLKFPNCHFISNDKNLGFGKAHNLVLKQAKTEYILVLNPDTEIKKGVLTYIINFLEENPDVGVASSKVLLDNGQLDWASHRGFPTPMAAFLYYVLGNDSLYHLTKNDLNKTHEVDAISGAFFLTRKPVLDKVGYFDEDFFMYGEDLDLCFRIKEAGFKVMYIPEVTIIHHKGVSSGLKDHSQKITTADLETKKRSVNAFYKAMQIFYKKHYSKKNLFFINWLVNFGIYIKWWLAKRKLTV